MILGAHVSIAGGLDKAPAHGASIKAETVQVFTRSQLQWGSGPLESEQVRTFRKGISAHNLEPVTVHASYLINPATGDEELLHKSADCLVDDLGRAHALGAEYLVLHPGSHGGDGEKIGLTRAGNALRGVLEQAGDDRPMLLLENTAGQGNGIGHRWEHLRDLLETLQDFGGVGICVDTCHAYASGYDLSEATYDDFVRELDRIVGLEAVRAFHLNDSKRLRGSRVDRHERIGAGSLGLEAFRRLTTDPRFAGLPGYLEVPGGNPAYREDLRLLRGLRAPSRNTNISNRSPRG